MLILAFQKPFAFKKVGNWRETHILFVKNIANNMDFNPSLKKHIFHFHKNKLFSTFLNLPQNNLLFIPKAISFENFIKLQNFMTQRRGELNPNFFSKNPKNTKINTSSQKGCFQIPLVYNPWRSFSSRNGLSQRKDLSNSQSFSRQDLIEGIKNKRFSKIIFLTGAGISVSAGIPDFRSPKTGLYENLKAYNLPYPEAVFEIDYFKRTPQAFYRLIKELSRFDAKPTITHHFMKVLADEGLLNMIFTQNIDGLEVKAGLDPKYMVEAHGHTRTAHCIECGEEASIQEFMKNVENQTIYRCKCSGLIKPDIVFFGELLPDSFFTNLKRIKEGDLVVVMGTSLQVFPFASLVSEVSKEVPLVYINRENTSLYRENFLFLEGDIDESIKKLINDLDWKEKFALNL